MKNEFYIEGRLVENPVIIENLDTKTYEIDFKVKTTKGYVFCKYEEIKEVNARFKFMFTKDSYVKIEGHLEVRNNVLIALVQKISRKSVN